MSLRCFLERKLFCQSCYSKYGGVWRPNYVIEGQQCRSLERHFVNRTPLFLSSHGSARLLSISLSKLNIFSRLTAYFTNEKEQQNGKGEKQVYATNDCNVKGSEERSKVTEDSISVIVKDNKWRSLVDSLPLSSPYNISKPVTAALKESVSPEISVKRQQFCQEIVESAETFLEQYNKDLDVILEKATPKCSRSKSKDKSRKSTTKTKVDDKTEVLRNIQYPVIQVRKVPATKTKYFDETKQFLQSMNIPSDELESYPVIQEMDKKTIVACLDMLKEKGIRVVFSLFLIERIHLEMKHLHDKKSSKKKQPVTSFRQVKAYLDLCQLLDTPDLDIRKLLEQLANSGLYIDILTLYKKVKKLRDIGATSQDILSNLEILQGYEFFDQKIELYKMSPHAGQDPFPVHLFLAKTMNSFKEKLALGEDVDAISKLLGVSVTDFQTCWGFKYQHTSKLQYKVQMCLSAGISQRDIFNNLGVLVRMSVEQCHAVTTSFRVHGLPASVFVLSEVVNAANLSGNGKKSSTNNCGVSTNEHKPVGTSSREALDEDWTGEAKTLFTDESAASLPPKKKQSLNLRKKELSTKKHRRSIFNLIDHMLHLDKGVVSVMYECHINASAVDVLDIPKNLDYLLSLNLTKEHIALCPLVLANSHSALVKVVHEAENLILMQFQSVPSSAPATFDPLPGLSPSPSLLQSSSYHTNAKDQLCQSLLNNPLQRLNIYQYFLERENSFSLASTESERMAGFLNV